MFPRLFRSPLPSPFLSPLFVRHSPITQGPSTPWPTRWVRRATTPSTRRASAPVRENQRKCEHGSSSSLFVLDPPSPRSSSSVGIGGSPAPCQPTSTRRSLPRPSVRRRADILGGGTYGRRPEPSLRPCGLVDRYHHELALDGVYGLPSTPTLRLRDNRHPDPQCTGSGVPTTCTAVGGMATFLGAPQHLRQSLGICPTLPQRPGCRGV